MATIETNLALRLMAKIALIVFSVEGLVMLLMSGASLSPEALREALIDATLLTVVAAPLIYKSLLLPFYRQGVAAERSLKTSLQNSEIQARQLAAALADLRVQKLVLDQHCIVSRTDRAGRIVYANAQFLHISGYAEEEILGKNHSILNSGAHSREFWHDMYEKLTTKGIWQGEVCNKAKDGRLYWVHATNVADKDENGRLTGYISVRTDITATKLRERELIEAYARLREITERAEAANRAKTAFLSTMSHEMRTPLNGVIGVLELLAQEHPSPNQKDLLKLGQDAGHALLVHINDVLDFAKLEAGKIDLHPEAYQPAALLQEVAGIVAPLAQSHASRVEVRVDPAIPSMLNGDVNRLRQILLNLASNAAKFTRGGRVSLEACLVTQLSGNFLIEFAVTDSGPGIPREKVGELFREFSMLDAGYARAEGGTGLGLAICKRLVEVMGGEIDVDTEVGRGSRFWFRISFPAVEDACRAGTAAAPEYVHVRRLKILLTDDSATNRTIGSRLVNAAGHDVVLARSGGEAIEICATVRFDALLMDISMPEMDGIEATKCIRQLPGYAFTPIIALTAHAVVGDRERFLAAGMTAYVTKPLRLQALRDVLATTLGAIDAETRAA